MALKDIREQIKVILCGVSGIGVVHDYMRFSNNWGKFISLFKDADGKINGWMFTRKKTPKSLQTKGDSNRTHHFVLYGFYALQDDQESEIVFQDLIEAIDAKFASYDTLNGTCFCCSPTQDAQDKADGIQVDVVEVRMFGDVLCHYAELSLYVQETF